jgi:hypothetical protein
MPGKRLALTQEEPRQRTRQRTDNATGLAALHKTGRTHLVRCSRCVSVGGRPAFCVSGTDPASRAQERLCCRTCFSKLRCHAQSCVFALFFFCSVVVYPCSALCASHTIFHHPFPAQLSVFSFNFFLFVRSVLLGNSLYAHLALLLLHFASSLTGSPHITSPHSTPP